MKYSNIREEELKNKVGVDWFKHFDTTEIVGNIDFTVFPIQKTLFERVPLLWAEAKTGNYDIPTMFVQLILTIGKARTFDKTLPPAFLGAFDFKKIAFVPFINIQDIFFINDFNWNVTPSNHETREFNLIKERIELTLKQNTYIYDFQKDEKELKFFIANNIAKATESSKIKIDKNNFIPIYLRWLDVIKPIINVNWEDLKKANILDSDFYLADLFVDDKDTNKIDDDSTIRENLFVIFQNQGYKIAKENIKLMFDATIDINNKDIYQLFWKRYKRPPIKEFQEYIIERRDLLVPQDIRERKGAFFTPRQWVELSQKYLTDYLGENWQDDYYVWDCAAGTGNLLAGLTNKYNIYASTLDQADVNVMHERIDHGANLLKNHVFQFDFLNDEFIPVSKGGKLPDSLFDIINNEEKRNQLVIYINPPYAEATSSKTISSSNSMHKENVGISKTKAKYEKELEQASKELYVQFIYRIYKEIPDCIISHFSKVKTLQGNHYANFRNLFLAKLEKLFLVPADTFDNVKGKFPIGFFIWNTKIKSKFNDIYADVYNKYGNYFTSKYLFVPEKRNIKDWLRKYNVKDNQIAWLVRGSADVQNNNVVFITLSPSESVLNASNANKISILNLIVNCIFLTVRKVVEQNWINDRDQYLYPNIGWETDIEFQNDCFVYALFDNSNNIKCGEGTNHWIPFTEQEVDAQNRFESHFMTDFINGKLLQDINANLFGTQEQRTTPLEFSAEAQEVFNAGRELWKYYHSKPNVNVNASFYDIREYFQGRNIQGKMNNKSEDETYMQLIGNLREKLIQLGSKIEPKIYEYGFLK